MWKLWNIRWLSAHSKSVVNAESEAILTRKCLLIPHIQYKFTLYFREHPFISLFNLVFKDSELVQNGIEKAKRLHLNSDAKMAVVLPNRQKQFTFFVQDLSPNNTFLK
jgi:hypothetical protein